MKVPAKISNLKVGKQQEKSLENLIKIPFNFNACTTDSKKVNQFNNFARRSSLNISDQKERQREGLVFPSVERKESCSSSNCLVFDLLQLANSCSRANRNEIVSRRVSIQSGENYLRSTISTTQKRNKFEGSFNSVPEANPRQKRGSLIERKPIFKLSPPSDDDQNKFARSWPLSPLKFDRISNQLPKLSGKNTNAKLETDSFSNHLKKFNKSRAFRMNDSCKTETKTNFVSKTVLIDFDYDKMNGGKEMENFTKKKKEVTTEADLALQKDSINFRITGTLKKLSNHEARQESNNKSNVTSPSESDLTNVTKETDDEIRPQVPQKTYCVSHNNEEEEVRTKCIKWLEDVARERLLNPEQVFLPHLLMP